MPIDRDMLNRRMTGLMEAALALADLFTERWPREPLAGDDLEVAGVLLPLVSEAGVIANGLVILTEKATEQMEREADCGG